MKLEDSPLTGLLSNGETRLRCLIPPLPGDVAPGILLLASFLDLTGKLDGPSYHEFLMEWVESGYTTEKDLKIWLAEKLQWDSYFTKSWDRARKEGERRWKEGTWIAVRAESGSPRLGGSACPRVIFGRGSLDAGNPWVAVFNSRKPRIVTGREAWLKALRRILPVMESIGFGFASSNGTTTYDLVAAYAEKAGSKTLLVYPSGLDGADGWDSGGDRAAVPRPTVGLSCMSGGCRCPKTVRPVCRDRLLAFLADVHCVIEIRPGGNLYTAIEAQQEKNPRPLVIFQEEDQVRGNEGNRNLLERFPERAKTFCVQDFVERPDAPQQAFSHSGVIREVKDIAWGDYLYHYTRGCRGPWPGQSQREYLLDLLSGEPFCAHSALDTLIRILSEGVLRASSRLLKGKDAVVSWTSRPPLEITSLRLWNRGLIRWTFEPYGLAISRRVLKAHGTRPTIYAGADVRNRLKPADRYRFQKHEPPLCSWKHEREWRLRKDLELKGVSPTDWFAFVPDRDVCEVLNRRCEGAPSAVVLSEVETGSG